MDSIAQMVGIPTQDFIELLILAAILVAGLFILRFFFKLTAAVFRLGCLGIGLLVTAVYLLQLFSQ